MTKAPIARKANIHAGFRAMAFRKATSEGDAEKAGRLPVRT
jgi:hypothetical protein